MTQNIAKEFLDLVPEEIDTMDEAMRVAKLVSRQLLDARFGAAFVEAVHKKCEGGSVSPQIQISRDIGDDAPMYEIQAEAVFITAALIAPRFVVTMEQDGDATGILPVSTVLEATNSDAYVFFHTIMPRPGWAEFTADLEYNHYPPGTPNNELIKMFWTVIPPRHEFPVWLNFLGVPKQDEHLAEQAAATAGLRFSKDDVASTIISPEGMFSCPLTGKNIYAMSNISSHPIYALGPNNVPLDTLLRQDEKAARDIAASKGFMRTK